MLADRRRRHDGLRAVVSEGAGARSLSPSDLDQDVPGAEKVHRSAVPRSALKTGVDRRALDNQLAADQPQGACSPASRRDPLLLIARSRRPARMRYSTAVTAAHAREPRTLWEIPESRAHRRADGPSRGSTSGAWSGSSTVRCSGSEPPRLARGASSRHRPPPSRKDLLVARWDSRSRVRSRSSTWTRIGLRPHNRNAAEMSAQHRRREPAADVRTWSIPCDRNRVRTIARNRRHRAKHRFSPDCRFRRGVADLDPGRPLRRFRKERDLQGL